MLGETTTHPRHRCFQSHTKKRASAAAGAVALIDVVGDDAVVDAVVAGG